jgi:hypothetical protein
MRSGGSSQLRRLVDEVGRKGGNIDPLKVWSAIRYLDPDEKDHETAGNILTMIAALAVLVSVFAVWAVLWLRIRGL